MVQLIVECRWSTAPSAPRELSPLPLVPDGRWHHEPDIGNADIMGFRLLQVLNELGPHLVIGAVTSPLPLIIIGVDPQMPHRGEFGSIQVIWDYGASLHHPLEVRILEQLAHRRGSHEGQCHEL